MMYRTLSPRWKNHFQINLDGLSRNAKFPHAVHTPRLNGVYEDPPECLSSQRVVWSSQWPLQAATRLSLTMNNECLTSP